MRGGQKAATGGGVGVLPREGVLFSRAQGGGRPTEWSAGTSSKAVDTRFRCWKLPIMLTRLRDFMRFLSVTFWTEMTSEEGASTPAGGEAGDVGDVGGMVAGIVAGQWVEQGKMDGLDVVDGRRRDQRRRMRAE